MFGWERQVWILSSRMNCSVIYSYFKSFFQTIFSAHMKLFFFQLTRNTFPYFPVPSSLICQKSLIAIFFVFFLLHDFLTHSAVGSSSILLSFIMPQLLVSDASVAISNLLISYFDDYGLYASLGQGTFLAGCQIFFFSLMKVGILLVQTVDSMLLLLIQAKLVQVILGVLFCLSLRQGLLIYDFSFGSLLMGQNLD